MKSRKSIKAFTLIELLMAATVFSLIGGIIYYILNTGIILFAKNTAINMAHQQARTAVIQMESDLHSAISLPQLIDANRAAVSGTGPAAGISFQTFAAGPFKVAARADAGANSISVALGSYQPKAGQRLIIPTHQIELDIASNVSGSGTRSIPLVSPTTNAVEVQLDDAGTLVSVDVIAFITDRISYVVVDRELRYFGRQNSASYTVMANDITSPTPFSTPTTPAGAPFYRFVAAINLSTADATATARGFKSANMFLNAQVPCRARLCAYQ
jgi:prepilin-type N-terminal cleavage/methylation domain-containing protein